MHAIAIISTKRGTNKKWAWMHQNVEAAWLQPHQRGLGCSSVHTLHISLYMTVFLSWVFSFREAVQTKGPVRPFFIYAAPLCFTRHARIQTSGIQYFTAGVKFQRLLVVSPMRLVWRHNRARRSTERQLCSCLNSTAQPTDTEAAMSCRGRSDSGPSRAEWPSYK